MAVARTLHKDSGEPSELLLNINHFGSECLRLLDDIDNLGIGRERKFFDLIENGIPFSHEDASIFHDELLGLFVRGGQLLGHHIQDVQSLFPSFLGPLLQEQQIGMFTVKIFCCHVWHYMLSIAILVTALSA